MSLHSLTDPEEGERPTVEEQLEAIPEGLQLADEVDLDSPDPALHPSGRRFCIAERRAGGRCTAPALITGLLCSAHGGLLDSSAGGLAKAALARERHLTADETRRLAALGARGVIAETLHSNPSQLRRAVLLLLEDAARGDKAAAKALIPFLNQGLGMPTETTVLVGEPESAHDLASMSTSELAAFVAAKRSSAA